MGLRTARFVSLGAVLLAAASFAAPAPAAAADLIPLKLPLHQGLPIARYFPGPSSAATAALAEQIEVQRWLALMHLAARPALLDDPRSAMAVLAAFVPAAEWSKYATCGSRSPTCESEARALKGEPAFGRSGPASWKGTDAQQWAHSQKAFVAQYREPLRSAAPPLPQEMFVARSGSMKLDAAGGGLLIRASGFLEGMTTATDPRRKLTIAGLYSAPVDTRLPPAIPCAADACNRILDQIPDRQKILKLRPITQNYPVYLLVKARLTKVDASGGIAIGPGSPGGAGESAAEIVGPIQVFADAALTRKIHTFE